MSGFARLSQRFIDTVKTPKKYCDGGGVWLIVRKRVTKRGIHVTKHTEFRWMRDGNANSISLGPLHSLPMAKARELAQEYREGLAQGISPRKLRDDKTRKPNIEHIICHIVEAYIEAHKAGWSGRTEKSWRSMFELHVYPVKLDGRRTVGQLPIIELNTDIVLAILTPIWIVKNRTAKHIQNRLEILVRFAKAKYQLDMVMNPAQWRGHLEYLLTKPMRIVRTVSQPSLPWGRAPALFANLRNLEYGTARCVVMLVMLTGLRINAAIAAKWPEIDWENRRWRVPAERMKMHYEIPFPNDIFDVPLSDAALRVFWQLWANRRQDDEYIFPSPKRQRTKTKHMFENSASKFLHRICDEPITNHGFRASFRTWADARTWCEKEVKEMALGHSVGDETEKAYSRGDWYRKRAILMQVWGEYLETGNDVPVRIDFVEEHVESYKVGRFAAANAA